MLPGRSPPKGPTAISTNRWCPHGGVRLFLQKSTRLTQSTLGPCVVQIWSRNTPNFGPNEICDVHRVKGLQSPASNSSLRLTRLSRGGPVCPKAGLSTIHYPSREAALSSEYGTCETVEAQFWLGLSDKSPGNISSCFLFARKRSHMAVSPICFQVIYRTERYWQARLTW